MPAEIAPEAQQAHIWLRGYSDVTAGKGDEFAHSLHADLLAHYLAGRAAAEKSDA